MEHLALSVKTKIEALFTAMQARELLFHLIGRFHRFGFQSVHAHFPLLGQPNAAYTTSRLRIGYTTMSKFDFFDDFRTRHLYKQKTLQYIYNVGFVWVWAPFIRLTRRRERDSNPRNLSVQRFSRPPRSTTLPSLPAFCSNASAKVEYFPDSKNIHRI